MSNLNDKVLQWAKDRGIDNSENAPKQYMKAQEEMGEIAAAINKNDSEKLIDSFGDVQVTLIILAKQLGIDYSGSLQTAYNVIANRTGKTINGVFVKTEDL